MTTRKRHFLKTVATLLGSAVLAGAVFAQTFPAKPVTLMIPTRPAGCRTTSPAASTCRWAPPWASPPSSTTWVAAAAALPHRRC